MIGQIKERIRYFINPPIIQFSPPRTGSTLLWNTLRICYPKAIIYKRHSITDFQKTYRVAPIIISIRNPLDTISSSIQRSDKVSSKEIIEAEIRRYDQKGFWDILELKNKANVKILKYEDFAFNFPYLFSELEDFLQKSIPTEFKQLVTQEYSLQKVEERSQKLGEFNNYDEIDQIHGRHISKYRGTSGYYKEILGDEEIETIYTHFKDVFEAFEYDKPSK